MTTDQIPPSPEAPSPEAPSPEAPSPEATSASPIKRFVPLVVLLSLAGLIFAMGWHKYLSLESLSSNKEALAAYVQDHAVLAGLAFMLLYAGVVALSLPVASFLTLFGGLLFGGLWGGSMIVIAATLGALVIFFVAKTSLGETLQGKAGPWLSKLKDGFNDNAMSYLLFLRLVPVFPFWLVNIAPALLGVSASTFAIGTFIGIIPGTLAYAFVGAGLGSVIDAQRASYEACQKAQGVGSENCSFTLDTSALITPELLIAFAALGVVALIPIVLQKFKKKT